MNDPSEDADERLAPLLEYFGDRINRTFAYFFFIFELGDDEDLLENVTYNARAWNLHTIKNACLDTSLMGLRDLDDFLTVRKPRKNDDDIRASHFGYDASHSFLTVAEREMVNKLIAHTTTVGATYHDFGWDILELVTKGISQCMEFLNWIEKEYGLAHFNLYTAALVIRNRTESQLAFIRSEAEKQRDNKP